MTTSTIAQTLAANAAANPAPAAPSSTTGLGTDFKTFLTLLTTQLQNQDPMSPLDTNQMTQQLVAFSQVEQEINANDKLTNLVALQSTNQALGALPLVGHTIEYADNKGALVDGTATFGYKLPSDVASANIVISDANGKTVFQTPAETKSGFHSFTWDGSTIDGTTAPDGTYTFNVAAAASDQSAVQATLSAYGKVSAIDLSNSTPSLFIGSISEALSKVTGITN